jgi:hypothetical protein
LAVTDSTIIIWNNHMYVNNPYPGHAAMSIDGVWAKDASTYVSWWPGKKQDGLQLASPNLEFFADLKAEGYAPDHIIRVSALRADVMKSTWQQKRTKDNAHYKFLAKNCSTLVATVLKSGGKRGSSLARNQLVWTPLKVRDLAIDMGGVTMTWLSLLDEFVEQGYMNRADREVLTHLYKRDAKHGKNSTGNESIYAKGEKINAKSHLMFGGGSHVIGDIAKADTFFYASEGSLISSGTIHCNNGSYKRNFMQQNVPM